VDGAARRHAVVVRVHQLARDEQPRHARQLVVVRAQLRELARRRVPRRSDPGADVGRGCGADAGRVAARNAGRVAARRWAESRRGCGPSRGADVGQSPASHEDGVVPFPSCHATCHVVRCMPRVVLPRAEPRAVRATTDTR
jgi:hypothetical protein